MGPGEHMVNLDPSWPRKAELEHDPEVRAEWQYIARGYLILANQFERNGCKNISYASFPRIRDLDEGAS